MTWAPATLARQEVRRVLGPKGGRSLAAGLALAVLVGALVPLVGERLPVPERGLYEVVLGPQSPYDDALRGDPRFRIVEGSRDDVRAGRADLWAGVALEAAPGRPGEAALAAAREAVRLWTEDRMDGEADQAAAFPLAVDLVEAPPRAASAPPPPPAPSPTAAPTVPGAPTPTPSVLDRAPAGSTAQTGLRPDELELPMPGLGLLVAFAYVLPMNVVGQMCAGAFLQERTRRRGLLVLAAPIRPSAIVLGRLLPYLALAAGVALAATFLVGGGWIGLAAALPVVLLPIAVGALVGVLARSEREVTFLMTAVMTLFAFFLFLPAIFRALPPIAYLSPITAVLEALDGNAVPAGALLYATLPLSLASSALLATCVGLYRDETLHSPLGLGVKLRQGLARVTRRWGGAFAAGVLVVPFAFALELLGAAFLVPLGLRLLFPGFLLLVAVVEEVLKRLPARSRAEAGHGSAWGTAASVGAGFFVGEKLALLVAWVGLGDLELGAETLQLFGIAGGVLLLLPLALHIACARLALLGARVEGRRALARAGLLAAIALHAAYDLAVLTLGGGL